MIGQIVGAIGGLGHDIAGDAMTRLDAFLGTLADEGFHPTQDFPPSTIPILRGRVVGSLEGLVAEGAPFGS